MTNPTSTLQTMSTSLTSTASRLESRAWKFCWVSGETSGRIRPTVEDLFRLCESLVLFRAYDYILDDLLGGVPAGEPVKKSVKINPIEKQAKELNPQKQAKEFKEQKQITPTGYVNIPVQEKQDQKPIVDFKLGMEMNTDELNKQLDSLLIES